MRWLNSLLKLATLLSCPVLSLISNYPTIAQIIPDKTLGNENSVVNQTVIHGLPSDQISGGAIRGANLFHSFQEFNILSGRGAYFTNPNGIANIFTRVTGTNPSNIRGTLGVLGNANLFLINPNGLIFGPNANLNIGGSFVASTASGLLFNGFEYSTINPQAPPILTTNIPLGLQFRSNPGSIVNQSQAQSVLNLPSPTVPLPIPTNVGLEVTPGQTIALIGGDVQLNNGNLTAHTGQVFIGSVASPGMVSLAATPLGLNFNYDNIQNFGNIQLSSAVVNTSGLGGGKVGIQGGNVTLNGSQIFALTLGNLDGRGIDIRAQQFRAQNGSLISTFTLASGAGGHVNIQATDLVEMSGLGRASYLQSLNNYLFNGTVNPFDPNIVLETGTAGTGSAGNTSIDTGHLLMSNGAVIGTGTFTRAKGGDINIRATNVEIITSGINSGTLQGSTGTGGNITIETSQFTMRDSGGLASLTRGDGASGNIAITATDSVSLFNTSSTIGDLTTITSGSIGMKGKAGDITILTKRFIASNGSRIASTSGFVGGNQLDKAGGIGGNLTIRATESVLITGITEDFGGEGPTASALVTATGTSSRGGDIHISTPVLILQDGALISAASKNAGDAGSINIDAGKVEVIGSANNGQFFSTIEASAGNFSNITNPNATGNAGELNLTAQQLMMRDGGTISVGNLGTGSAGSINIRAVSVMLDNHSSLNGSTVSGGGGNINLQAQDIQLRHHSRISTDAGTSNGGNITLNGETLVAFPLENSDITANARTALGGSVTINVPNIFGVSAISREQLQSKLGLTDQQFAALTVNPTFILPSSDISAISQAAGPSLQGKVTFSTSGVNPAQGLVTLPQTVVDPANLIASNPCAKGGNSEFVIAGRGGLPSTPSEPLRDNRVLVNWSNFPTKESQLRTGLNSTPDSHINSPIIPAQGWIINNDLVTLTAYNPKIAGRSPKPSVACPSGLSHIFTPGN